MTIEVRGFQPKMLGVVCLTLWLGKNFAVQRYLNKLPFQWVASTHGLCGKETAWAIGLSGSGVMGLKRDKW